MNQNKFDSFVKDNKNSIRKEKRMTAVVDNLDSFLFRNSKHISMGVVELFNNTVLHGMDTLKVRLQAKSLREDVSLFYKNKVQSKPLISGVTSAGIGSFLAGFCFISANEYFLHFYFRKNKKTFLDEYNWKAKMIVSYILSDIVKAIVFLPFEARKQRIQMSQKISDLGFLDIGKYTVRAFMPMIFRDILFRAITLGTFLNSLSVEHKPALKYKLKDIRDVIKNSEKRGEKVNVSYFMDYSKFNIYSNFPAIFINLIACTVFATIITQPIDVTITKILTQTRLKYKGLFQGLALIVNEDGYKKIFYSGLSIRISFNILSATSVFLMYDMLQKLINDYYDTSDDE